MDVNHELLALLELKRRREAAEHLDNYCRYIEIPGAPLNEDEDLFYPDTVTPAEHHQLLNEKLEEVERGEIKSLMVFMPPGSAKSTYASVTFPTWYMGKNPNKNIIATSYNSELAKKFGRKCRAICKSPGYYEIFKEALETDNKAADDWSITNKSTYMSGGILSGITGNRADGLILDDPVKGRQDADSDTIRNSTWEAYKSDLRTRLKPNGWKILIQTRWHEDDIAGRILPETWDGESGYVTAQDGELWYVLCLPAQCDRPDDPLGRQLGEYLWTDWFSIEHWEQEKRTQGSRNWNALYQGKPSPDEGGYYKKEWFVRYSLKHKPKNLNYYLCADYAVSDDDTADFTEIGVFGIDENDDTYIVDWHQGQEEVNTWIEQLINFIKLYKPISHTAETGVIKKASEPYIRKAMRKDKAFTTLGWLPHSAGNKPAMGRSFQALAENGVIHVPHTEWGDALISQLVKFPSGKYDDKCDACAIYGRMIADMWEANKAKLPPDKPKISGLQEFRVSDFFDD